VVKVLKLKKISGKNCVKLICNKFSFKYVRQSGSHIILKKISGDTTITCVVPNHSEIKINTLKGLLKQAKIRQEDFIKYQ